MQHQSERKFSSIYTAICCIIMLSICAYYNIFGFYLKYSILPITVFAIIFTNLLGYKSLIRTLGKKRYLYSYLTMLFTWMIGTIFSFITLIIQTNHANHAYLGTHASSTWHTNFTLFLFFFIMATIYGIIASFISFPLTWLANIIYNKKN